MPPASLSKFARGTRRQIDNFTDHMANKARTARQYKLCSFFHGILVRNGALKAPSSQNKASDNKLMA